jgi:hypothetical protein
VFQIGARRDQVGKPANPRTRNFRRAAHGPNLPKLNIETSEDRFRRASSQIDVRYGPDT